jgi:hypothetical protein
MEAKFVLVFSSYTSHGTVLISRWCPPTGAIEKPTVRGEHEQDYDYAFLNVFI